MISSSRLPINMTTSNVKSPSLVLLSLHQSAMDYINKVYYTSNLARTLPGSDHNVKHKVWVITHLCRAFRYNPG